MKEIEPVSIWYNGQMVQATVYNMVSINDNLSTSVTFYYQLYSASQLQLTNGNLTMDGADYTTYSTSLDSNAYAYSWGATKLNLTLV